MSPQQLPLAVQLPDDEIFSTFLAGDNSTLLSWLESLPTTELTAEEKPAIDLVVGSEWGREKAT